jgi:transposase
MLSEVSDPVLATQMTWKLSHHLPRVADVVMFQSLHEMLHLGQLASWRRARGLPAAMARMAELRL